MSLVKTPRKQVWWLIRWSAILWRVCMRRLLLLSPGVTRLDSAGCAVVAQRRACVCLQHRTPWSDGCSGPLLPSSARRDAGRRVSESIILSHSLKWKGRHHGGCWWPGTDLTITTSTGELKAVESTAINVPDDSRRDDLSVITVKGSFHQLATNIETNVSV